MNTPMIKGAPLPRGTRSLLPDAMSRQHEVESLWRRVAIEHGFEEIRTPILEHADLYRGRSGPGIEGEMFLVKNGKATGDDWKYCLRPETTAQVARMYIDLCRLTNSTPTVRWFSIGPCFRCEKPQRGRLREFVQFNCDVISAEDRCREEASDLLHRALRHTLEGLLVIRSNRAMPEHRLSIANHIDDSLTRGQDYYDGLVFEAYAEGLGRAVAGGGEWGKLIRDMGGPDVYACGFGMGDAPVLALDAEVGV